MSSRSNSSIYSTESLSDMVSDTESFKTNIDLHGDIINNYNVITKLGSGTFSHVWLVYSIKDNKYYALKVQNFDDYEEGKDEVLFLKKLKPHKYVNNLIDCFTEKRFVNEKIEKFICSVYDICSMNLHQLLKLEQYRDGLPYEMVMRIYNQVCEGLDYLHNTVRVFHGDIKPDNILVCGINKRVQYYIDEYNTRNFMNIYSDVKKKYWVDKGKKIENIKKMPIDVKLKIRKQVHESIINSIKSTSLTNLDIDESLLIKDGKYNINIKISDFGSHCCDDEKMEDTFGTQYYMAPEMILVSDCKKSVDIWALGCTLYELLTNELLFDPDGDTSFDTDIEHLKLISEICGKFDNYIFSNGKRYHKFFSKHKLRIPIDKHALKLEQILDKYLPESEHKKRVKELLLGMIQIIPHNRKKISACKLQASM